MAQRKVQFANGEIYHIVMRALDGLLLFREKRDYLRMIHDLFEFNDLKNIPSKFRVDFHRKNGNVTSPGHVTSVLSQPREMLVDILTFCLMPNHVHLMVRQRVDNGISKFMQKFGGYARFYNEKYGRKGHLFQNKFHEVHVQDDEQLKTVFVYIHTNPVALIYPKWKEQGISNAKKAVVFVEDFRWSSYPDYLGKKNFPSLTTREWLLETMGRVQGCRDYVNAWIQHKKELKDFDLLAIE